jgi:lipopolysaccharide/colanic/teichoic acid biosynthesis glycosyltransferase
MANQTIDKQQITSTVLTPDTATEEFDPAVLDKKCNGIYNLYVKRIIDVVLASILFIVLLPVYAIISLAITIESGFPIFYRAERGGYKDSIFKINKFRTMVKDADKIGGGTTALNDSRITKVGAFLRKTKLDEIAQLLNIISGSMSFIGPRPELVQYTSQYTPLQKRILNVRPGITDFSSIEFINLDELVGADNADEIYEKYILEKKNNLRLKYVNEISFATDVKLFFSTVTQVIKKALKIIFKGKNDGIHNS